MIGVEAAVSLGAGFLSGAGLIIWRAGVLLGELRTSITLFATSIAELRGDVKELGEKIHALDTQHATTRARLESMNGCETGERESKDPL